MNRRAFLGAVVSAVAATELITVAHGHSGSGAVPSGTARYVGVRADRSLGPLKQIDAGVLNVGYAEASSPDGPPVLLLHGWPYDIHSFAEVAPILSERGYRVIVPYLRGFGTTRFLSPDTVRNGQQSVIALDVIALMDALGIERAVSIVIHNYRWRLGLANGEARCDEIERRLAAGPDIAVPTITLEGDANGAPRPDATSYAGKFSGRYAHRIIKNGIGHNLPQEAPHEFAQAIIDVDRF